MDMVSKKIKEFKMVRSIIALTFLLASTVCSAQECFYPAHNYSGYTSDLTNATGWSRPSTITNDTTTTTPPRVYGITQTYKGVGVAGQSAFWFGATGNKYVIDGVKYHLSIYVKYSNFQWVRFGTSGSGTIAGNYDIQNGVVGVCNFDSCAIEPVGDGWYRLSALYTGNIAATSNSFRLRLSYTTTSSGVDVVMAGGETLYFTAPQAMDARVTSPENKKYVETTNFNAVWAAPLTCPVNVRKW